MFMMTCPWCQGRGWAWRGVASNAIREACEECAGTGRGRIEWGPLVGLGLILMSAALCLALLATAAFGASAGDMTLAEFRAQPRPVQAALVAGGLATTEHLGLRCPPPVASVAEYISALTWRKLDEQRPWVGFFLDLVAQRGCRVEDDSFRPALPQLGPHEERET